MGHIHLDGISKSFAQKRVIEDVQLEIPSGQFMSLVGPSGCGKSTLLRIISGLEAQTEGSVLINGRVVDGIRPADRDLAMVFQSYALYPHMTVGENIALPLVMRELRFINRLPLIGRFLPTSRAGQARIGARVLEVARQLGLQDVLERKPGQLSGGQRQRVALARAMIRRPAAFLMDEPLSNLDVNMRSQVRGEISDLHRQLGTTVVYVTHDQTEAMTMSDRVAVLLEGRLQQVDTPRAIYETPATLSVARFFGDPAINVIAGVVRSDRAIDVQGLIFQVSETLPVGEIISVAVRPEHMAISTGASCSGWAGTVTGVEYLGSLVHTRINLSSGDSIQVRAQAGPEPAAIGSSVLVHPVPTRVLVFDASGSRLRTRTDYFEPGPMVAVI